MATPDHSQTNSFVEWLSTQWYFLTALVLGAGHAATAQSKINQHEQKLEALAAVTDRLSRIETHQEHILELLRKRRYGD